MKSSNTSAMTPSRSKAVQDVKEQCCSRLGANFLLIGTGQNALSGTPLLQRLQGRFPVTVELQDTDVEQVTREVVLKKKPTAEAGLKRLLDDHSGEIERQLASTKIAFNGRDRGLLVQDYPILPVRRRFWERVLRAVDKAGTGAQLRNQLWVVYDAVKQTAEWALGNVVMRRVHLRPHQVAGPQSGTLLQEISETIAKQKKEDDGELRFQSVRLIFLIGQLPRQRPLDAGVRADAETLADLLVTDLTKSSAELRKKVPIFWRSWSLPGRSCRSRTSTGCRPAKGPSGTRRYLEARNEAAQRPRKTGQRTVAVLRRSPAAKC